jgi:hypothetical protein
MGDTTAYPHTNPHLLIQISPTYVPYISPITQTTSYAHTLQNTLPTRWLEVQIKHTIRLVVVRNTRAGPL